MERVSYKASECWSNCEKLGLMPFYFPNVFHYLILQCHHSIYLLLFLFVIIVLLHNLYIICMKGSWWKTQKIYKVKKHRIKVPNPAPLEMVQLNFGTSEGNCFSVWHRAGFLWSILQPSLWLQLTSLSLKILKPEQIPCEGWTGRISIYPLGLWTEKSRKRLLKSMVAAIYKDLYSLFIFFLNLQDLFSII